MAMKVKATNASRARSRLVGILVALAVIIVVSILTAISSAETKKVVTVVRIKDDISIPANALIKESMIEPYDMYYKEFRRIFF